MNRTSSHFAPPLTQSCERHLQPLRLNPWPMASALFCAACWVALFLAVAAVLA